MKKLFGLLVIGTVGMFIACSSDDSDSNPYKGAAAVTPAECTSMGMVYNVDPTTGTPFCTQPAANATSSSDAAVTPTSAADPASSDGAFTPGPVATSSSDVVAPAASSSSVAATPAVSSSSAATPATPASSAETTPATPASSAAEDPAPATDGFSLWDGAKGSNQVSTGNKKGGYWYTYTDKSNKGESTLEWDTDAEVGSTYSDDDLTPVIKACGGLCGKFNLVAGGNTDCAPYVAVAFDIGNGKAGEDLTAAGGICVTYTSTMPIEVDLGLGSKDADYGYNIPGYILKVSAAAKTVDIAWDDFVQQWSSDDEISGEEAAAMLVTLKFQVKGEAVEEDGGDGTFLISKVGPLGSCK